MFNIDSAIILQTVQYSTVILYLVQCMHIRVWIPMLPPVYKVLGLECYHNMLISRCSYFQLYSYVSSYVLVFERILSGKLPGAFDLFCVRAKKRWIWWRNIKRNFRWCVTLWTNLIFYILLFQAKRDLKYLSTTRTSGEIMRQNTNPFLLQRLCKPFRQRTDIWRSNWKKRKMTAES